MTREERIAKGWPVPYLLDQPGEHLRLLRECSGYLHTCRRQKHGTDDAGRRFAMEALEALVADFKGLNHFTIRAAAVRAVGDEELREALEHLDVMGGGKTTTGSAKAASVLRRLSASYSAACGERDEARASLKAQEMNVADWKKVATENLELAKTHDALHVACAAKLKAAESQLSLALVERDRARTDALEEAANCAFPRGKTYHPDVALLRADIAVAIRKLKSTGETK